MIIFVLFCTLFYKKLYFTKKTSILVLCIASPFLLELLFFWNNDSLIAGLKSAEKTVSLLLLPICIIGNKDRINFQMVLRTYVYVSVLLVLFLFIRFMVISPKFFDVYLKGMELWEVGYEFANSFGMHGPALNMHLAFITCCSFWFVFEALKNKKAVFLNIFFVLLSFFFVLFVNTRLALLNVILGVVVIFIYDIMKRYNIQKVILLFITCAFISAGIMYFYIQKNPYMKEKYAVVTLAHIDKIGDLDSLENPEAKVSNSLVTRLSIWKSALELSKKHLLFGVGSSNGKQVLFDYYEKTNQKFLFKYRYPVHNQYLDFTIKFGILGLLVSFLYMFTLGYLGFTTKNSIIIIFFLIFFLTNFVDDFLIRFDGIVFSGLWSSLFVCYWNKFTDSDK
ncbi:O-antigen ligase family protein [Mariniflexile aquimaris]|uniref:O-antigen ligase family protein n=2 Tax=Mariniflexile aquimaris TaxID=881009 RepID=A0ABW3BQB3_9FLAO